MNVELEHGLHDLFTNVSDDDPRITAKIALAHLNESPTAPRAWNGWKKRRSATRPDEAATGPAMWARRANGNPDGARTRRLKHRRFSSTSHEAFISRSYGGKMKPDVALRRGFAAIAGTASLAFVPGAASAATGQQLFAQEGCSGCHTLQAAGASGQGGPDLDQLRPSAAAVAAQVTSGGPGMPSFGGTLAASDIQALASWVSAVSGGTSGTLGSAGATTLPPPIVPTTTMSTAKVRRLQSELAKLGFFRHVVTGYYGPVTTTRSSRPPARSPSSTSLQACPGESVRFNHVAGTKVSLATATVDQLDELRKRPR